MVSSASGVSAGTQAAQRAAGGRRERRARETRQRILTAAFELFVERGVDGATVEEIAERADVARGTVFNYFPSKDTLCGSIGSLMMDRVQEAMERDEVAGLSAGEKITRAMRLMTEFPVKEPHRFREVMLRGMSAAVPGELPEHRRRELELLESLVVEGQDAGEFRTDYPAHEIAGFMLGLHFQTTLVWALGFVPGSPADHTARMVALALEGVRSRD